MALIDKDDFSAYVPWSDNIKAPQVDVHCFDAQTIDVYPLLPTAKVSGNNMTDDIIFALTESPVTQPELVAFWNDYVKPLIVLKAYCRFLLYHGRNITQYGIRVNNEDTSNDVGDKGRGELMADNEHKANVYLMKLKERLDAVNYTFDSVVYEYACNNKPKAKTRIVAI